MADASRFPHLALPFAIAAATAGWLSAGLAYHPVVNGSPSDGRLVAAGLAAVLGAAAGAVSRRLCAPRYAWDLDAPDPGARPSSDSWPRHASVLLCAGAATGAAFAWASPSSGVVGGVVGGLLCAVPFLPVFAAVLAAARRAQRARAGSLVAASDRRAVWGVLATALLLASLGALPDWPAPRGGPLHGPEPVLAILVLASACVLGVLAADVRAWRRAARVVEAQLTARDRGAPGLEDRAASRLDVGLGDALHVRVAPPAVVYRGRDRAVALVHGDPVQARAVLSRAVRRGLVGVAVAGAVAAAHAAAASDQATARYEAMRCELGNGKSCGAAADHGLCSGGCAGPGVREAIALYERGCDAADAASCMSLARLYRGESGAPRDLLLVAHFEYLAAQRGLCPEGTRLVHGAENVCVDPRDPRR